MRFQIRCILAGMFLMLASHSALAKDECPEGYVNFVNTETYQSVCLPVDVEKTQTQEAKAEAEAPNTETDAQTAETEAKTTDAAPEEGSNQAASDNAVNDDGQADTSNESQAEENPQPPAPQQSTPAPVFARPNPIEPVTVPVYPSADQNYQTFQTSDSDSYYDEVKASGWLLELGFGYGMIGNADIKFLTGYHFSSNDSVASFGLYLDADLRVGWYPVFSMDWTLDPTLHVSVSDFVFSLGIGVGIFSILTEPYEDYLIFDSEYNKKTSMKTLFELKPTLTFDWYMTGNAFFGFGFSVPLIFLVGDDNYDTNSFVQPWFNLDCHFGYKF